MTAYTRNEAENEIRRAVGKGEMAVRRSDEPATIEARTPTAMDKLRPLIEKYAPGLAELNTPEGIKTANAEAFAYGFINARLFGATDFYVEKDRQRPETWLFSMAGTITGTLQNLKLAGVTTEAAMASSPRLAAGLKTLQESGALGQTLARGILSGATFGGVETVQEGVKTAVGKSGGLADATKNVVKAGTIGAMFGVFEPLPIGARIPAVGAGSYGIEKVFGANDKEAAISALQNSIFAIAGGRGKVEELDGKVVRVTGENGTAANVKVSVESNGRLRLTEVAQNVKADLQVRLPKLREAARVNIFNESVPLSKENGGAIFRTTGEKAGEMKYLQTMRSRNGVVLKEISAEQYAKAKGTVRELEISQKQFEAANGVRLTADGKITTIFQTKLAKNLDSAQGVNLREPRLVTPTNAEFIRQIEVAKGLERVNLGRQQYSINRKQNIAFADFEVDGQKWTQYANSGEVSKKGTSPVPENRFFKTGADGGYDRLYDSEVKLFEEFAAKYANRASEVKGTIYVFTERPPCGSCTDVIPQFRKMFPNVRIEVSSGPYVEKQGVK